MAKQTEEQVSSSGVDALITRLRDEGVAAGRSEAEKIVHEAQSKANKILDKAQKEARQRLDAAYKESEKYKTAGEEALKTAIRDTVLAMKEALMERFTSEVRRLVSHQMEDPELIRKMILEVAGRASEGVSLEESEPLDVLLPERIVGLEELRRNPEELLKGRLTGLVLGLTGEMLRSGVTFSVADDAAEGIRVQLVDKDIKLDLSDKAVADLLLQHLQPRFRAVFEGVVK